MAGRASFFIYWMPVLFWMGLIFLFSTGLGSMGTSSRLLGPFLDLLFPWASPESRFGIQVGIRKTCHFVEYAVLTLLIWRALVHQGRRFNTEWRFRPVVLAALLSCLYAVTDELHQTFVANRSGSIVDVMIDATGALGGAGFARVCWACKRKWGQVQLED